MWISLSPANNCTFGLSINLFNSALEKKAKSDNIIHDKILSLPRIIG